MAVRHGYGKIAGTDALVFAYDTGDTKNSFKGEPTTNYGPANFGSWGTENTAQRIATGNTYQGQPTYNCRTTVGASWQGIDTTIAGLRTAAGSSGTVTMSCMVRNNNPSSYPMYAYIGHDFSSTRNIPANSGWQKVQWTVNQSSMNNDYVEFRPYTNNASLYLEMTMPMVEVNKGHATQFVNGTRSSTQGLLDLTGNKTISLTNTSFDANAQPAFDGTEEYFDLGSDQVFKTSGGWTVENIVRYDSVAGGYDNYISPANFIGSDTISYNSWYWSVLNNKLALWNISPGIWKYGSTTIQPNTWYHVALVSYDSGTQYQMYLNGVAEGGDHTTYSWNATYSGLRVRYIGAGQSTRRFVNGEIPVTKIYNRALTAAEVQTNYRHYKTRFNI